MIELQVSNSVLIFLRCAESLLSLYLVAFDPTVFDLLLLLTWGMSIERHFLEHCFQCMNFSEPVTFQSFDFGDDGLFCATCLEYGLFGCDLRLCDAMVRHVTIGTFSSVLLFDFFQTRHN